MLDRPALTGDLHQTWPGKKWWHKPGPWCRTKARLGRRGTMLLTLGWLYVLIGLSELVRPLPFYSWAYYGHVPIEIRITLWVGGGLAAMYFAFQQHRATQVVRWWQTDTYGWAFLYVPPLIRSTSYIGSFLAWLLTESPMARLLGIAPRVPPIGEVEAVVPFFVWLIPVWITIICSGWVENPRRGCP